MKIHCSGLIVLLVFPYWTVCHKYEVHNIFFADPDVIRGIRQCEAINKLVYISCKPEGFAMENFVKLGSTRGIASKRDKTAPFTPRYAVPVDLFPHTSHTELVILFERVYGS